MAEQAFSSEDWRVGLRIWIEYRGQPILGKGRLELLESIDRCHSINAAARALGMSYRHAWEQVQSMNEAAGEPLVETATGGLHGGGTQLTPLGRWAVSVFRELQDHVGRSAANLLPQLMAPHPAAEIHVAAAVSLEDVLGQLLNDYALHCPTVRVRVVFGASDELAAQLLAGAPGDLFLSADPRQFERLEAVQLLRPGSGVILAENGLAAIGSPHLATLIRRPRQLVDKAVSRIALAMPECPLGGYTQAYLAHLGLYEALRPRAVWVENARAVRTTVQSGQAEVGVVYSSDAAHAEGCATLFRTRRLSVPIRYAGAVLFCRGGDSGLAQSLLDFLTSVAAARCFRRWGFLAATNTQ